MMKCACHHVQSSLPEANLPLLLCVCVRKHDIVLAKLPRQVPTSSCPAKQKNIHVPYFIIRMLDNEAAPRPLLAAR
eukprot:3190181-Pleurochrysis_carterae.AAC.1